MDRQKNVPVLQLGSGGPEISILGIGTWAWGDRVTWGYGSGYTDADLRMAFETSVRAGITFYDTAEIYGTGQSERLLGDFARAAQAQVTIATKYFPFPWRTGREAIIKALRRSLERLGMEQVGLYQIHWPVPWASIESLMNGLADAVEAGLTRMVGVSNFNVEQTRRAHAALAARGIPLASNQVKYSLLCRQPEHSGLYDLCRDLGITLIAYSPLAQGLLTGKYTPENPPPGTRGLRSSRELLTRIQPLIALMKEIGAAHGGKTPAQVALNWVIAKGAVPIPGAKNARQAEENAGAMTWELADEEIRALDEISRSF